MADNKITIDGSQGEGGGQIVRTAIALSAITGKPMRLEFIRAGRKKPGLMRQHLTSIKAAAEICNATTKGVELGAEDIDFIPGEITGGDYQFTIGTAGSVSLVAQTIMPILIHARTTASVTITGGTHNLWAPTFDFLDQAFLPQFRAMGGRISTELVKYGFYPAGGGEIKLVTNPTKNPAPLELIERGNKVREQAIAIVSNLKRDIAVRELKLLSKRLDIKPEQGEILHVDSPGVGNVISLIQQFDNVTEVFANMGQHGVRAEAVASKIVEESRQFSISKAATGVHLADQLLLPMALMAGGVFTTQDISEHTRTNATIIKRFLDVEISFQQTARKCWTVEVAV